MTYREEIIARAAKSFAQHHLYPEITKGPILMFRCQREGSWIFGFWVVFGPGFISVHGDTGDGITFNQNGDAQTMLQWTRTSIKSEGYFISKLAGPLNQQHYPVIEAGMERIDGYIADEERIIRDEMADDPESYEGQTFEDLVDEDLRQWRRAKVAWQARLQLADDRQYEAHVLFVEALTEAGIGDSWEYGGVVLDYEPQVLWAYNALLTFVRLYNATESTFTMPDQRSVTDQLEDLYKHAIEQRMYDAADYMKMQLGGK